MRSAVERRIALRDDGTALALLAQAVEAFAEEATLPPRQAHDLGLILEELVTNTMMHGYGPGAPGGAGAQEMSVAMRRAADGRVQVELRDRARPFDPLAAQPLRSVAGLQDRPQGGIGVAIVQRLTRGGTYQRLDGCNVLTLDLRDPPP